MDISEEILEFNISKGWFPTFVNGNTSYSPLKWLVTSPPSNETIDAYVPYASRPETYIVPVIFVLIFFVGLVGNGALILIFSKHTSMRTIPNTYIMSLSVGDLLVVTGALPFVSTIYTVDSWPYGEFMCKLSEFVRDVSIGVTVLTLTMLSADRYLAIVMPFKRRIGRKGKKMTIFIAIGIWCISILLAFPGAYTAFLWEVWVTKEKAIYVCYPFPQHLGEMYPKVLVLAKFFLLYAIPLLLIATFYILMARHLITSSKNVTGSNQSDAHQKQMRGRTKVAKIILAFIVIFAVCFFPNHVFMLWYYFYPKASESYNDFWHLWRIAGFVLTFGNSGLNPVVLCVISGTFRKHFKQYLFCSKQRNIDLSRIQHSTCSPSHTAPVNPFAADLRPNPVVKMEVSLSPEKERVNQGQVTGKHQSNTRPPLGIITVHLSPRRCYVSQDPVD